MNRFSSLCENVRLCARAKARQTSKRSKARHLFAFTGVPEKLARDVMEAVKHAREKRRPAARNSGPLSFGRYDPRCGWATNSFSERPNSTFVLR